MRKAGKSTQSLKNLINKVATACRILTSLGLMDFLGHVSARVPNSDRVIFFRATSIFYPASRMAILANMKSKLVKGLSNPPIEAPLHLCLYRKRSDVGSVVHMHSPAATSFAISGKKIIPVLNQGVEAVASGVPMFNKPGLVDNDKLGDALGTALGNHAVCLMKNHGMVAVGGTVEEACLNAINLELQAKMNLLSLVSGQPQSIPPDILERVADLHKSRVITSKAWNYYVKLTAGSTAPKFHA